ncbi:Flp family type IVb pilin [Pseudooceanicola sp. LIPI14-2-Ac024]|uniref:Flp family type IVb pilin n=1 Tax=Pseudooceanicola sp. LIPI14-2-Ac024 TaxID=3344875 RepID=UPI0035D11A62
MFFALRDDAELICAAYPVGDLRPLRSKSIRRCMRHLTKDFKGYEKMIKFIKAFNRDEFGAAMVEYAIALLVAAGVGVATFSTMGTAAGTNATNACDTLLGATGSTGC